MSELANQIVSLWRRGYGVNEIARLLKPPKSNATVSRHLKRAGIDASKGNPHKENPTGGRPKEVEQSAGVALTLDATIVSPKPGHYEYQDPDIPRHNYHRRIGQARRRGDFEEAERLEVEAYLWWKDKSRRAHERMLRENEERKKRERDQPLHLPRWINDMKAKHKDIFDEWEKL